MELGGGLREFDSLHLFFYQCECVAYTWHDIDLPSAVWLFATILGWQSLDEPVVHIAVREPWKSDLRTSSDASCIWDLVLSLLQPGQFSQLPN